jgi:C_GCAxxG_C_C family probable redox protein
MVKDTKEISSLVKLSREETVQRAYDLGYEYLTECAICSQSALAALQDVFHIKNDDVFKAMTGFMGGGADTCKGACGGLTGGIAAISCIFGRTRTEFDFRIIDLSLRTLVKKLIDKFDAKFDGTLCREVHMKMFGRTFDIFDEEEVKLFLETLEKDERGGCAYPVANGCSIAAGIIWDELHNPNRRREDLFA